MGRLIEVIFAFLTGLFGSFKGKNIPETTTSKDIRTIAWGAHVTQTFRDRICWTADALDIPVNFLMAIIAFETAKTFRADVQNPSSKATGLIQFMSNTAVDLGTTLDLLKQMSSEDQIKYVYYYLLPYKGRIQTLEDTYMAVLYPAAIGKTSDYILFSTSSVDTAKAYAQNKGLDFNKDGAITKKEASQKVAQALEDGLLPINAWTGSVNTQTEILG